jgi:hypothetical protein
MQSDLRSYIGQISNRGGGGGGSFADPENAMRAFAPTDFQRQIANWGTGQIGQNFGGSMANLPGWQQGVQQAINSNPAVQGMAAPTAQGYSAPGMTQAQGYSAPGTAQANWLFSDPMSMQVQARGLSQDPMSMAPTAQGGGMNFMNPNAVPGWQGNIAFDPSQALGAAQNAMQRVIAPQLANNSVATGSNPMSGAYAEALANASSQMALPIMQQISQQQYGAAMPQIQGFTNAQLQQQGAQQGLQSQGFGGAIQGMLAQQGAQNQFTGQQLGTSLQGLTNQQQAQNQYQGQGLEGMIQGNLAQQGAQNQMIGQGLQGQIQGNLSQQGAQNQMMGQGYGSQLQALLNQGQNAYGAAMATPTMQGQYLQNALGAAQGQMGLQGMDQQARANAFLNAQTQWNQAMSAMSGTAFTNPGMSQYSSQSNQPNWMQGVFGMGAAALPGLIAMCWVADALYGEGSEEAEAARAWVSEGWQGEEADAFREWYKENGQVVAQEIKYNWIEPKLLKRYQRLFKSFVRKGREYLDIRRAA